tara:strand:+ start:1426 stop:2250 length:825 start_codon:yes stop_codon:yes gene_type:complete
MRLRHNKKRNTAFLYEILVKHFAIASLKKQADRANIIKSVIKEFFYKNKPLSKDFTLYKNLYEFEKVDSYTAHFLIQESKREYARLDRKVIFNEQTRLINWINKNLGRDSFNVFVPNYKTLATISQIFNQDGTPKQRVILEKKLMSIVMAAPSVNKQSNMEPMDQIVYRAVIERFNRKYGDQLLEEQKTLIHKYTLSFSDGGHEFTSYLNEEIGRIREHIKSSHRDDLILSEKLDSVLHMIEGFKKEPINERIIGKVLKLQSLARELKKDGNNN